MPGSHQMGMYSGLTDTNSFVFDETHTTVTLKDAFINAEQHIFSDYPDLVFSSENTLGREVVMASSDFGKTSHELFSLQTEEDSTVNSIKLFKLSSIAQQFYLNKDLGWIVVKVRCDYCNPQRYYDLYRVKNGTSSFVQRLQYGYEDINSMAFATEKIGWISFNDYDPNLYYTDDGGLTWTRKDRPFDDFTRSRFTIHPVSEEVLYAVTGNQLFRSADAGENWVSYSTDFYSIQSFQIVDEQYGFFIARQINNSYCIYKTSNGGIGWSKSGCEEYNPYEGLRFFDDKTGITTDGQNGTIRITNDACNNWSYLIKR